MSRLSSLATQFHTNQTIKNSIQFPHQSATALSHPTMALSLSWTSPIIKLNRVPASSPPPTTTIITCSRNLTSDYHESQCSRRPLFLGAGAMAVSLFPSKSSLADEIPVNYKKFEDLADGYSYLYPSDWRDFDFRGHDSAFKDRYLQLQNLRLSFIPIDKTDIHDLGPLNEVMYELVHNIYAAPNQKASILDLQERNVNGRNYYTVEFELSSINFGRTSFVTVAIGNGRLYTLNVGANERRWRRFRNQLKVVADSFKVFEI